MPYVQVMLSHISVLKYAIDDTIEFGLVSSSDF